MRGPVAALLVALSLAASGWATAAEQPTVRIEQATGSVVLQDLPVVLDDEVVADELHSGLTNTLLFVVTGRADGGRQRRGGVAVDIRYELWDEEYLIQVTGTGAAASERRVASPDELRSWWRELRLEVLPPGAIHHPGRWTFDVELQLLPFSRTEQRDAQLWFTRSVGSEPVTRRDGPEPVDVGRGPDTHDRVLDLLVATSIKRRTVVTYRWTATAVRGDGGEREVEP